MTDERISGLATMEQAVEFAWLEADLLDRRAYREWLKLWQPDARYVVPSEPDAVDFENQLNYIFDDASMRNRRVDRLLSGRTTSERPPTRTARSLSRFRITSNGSESLELSSSLLIVAMRPHEQNLLAANVTHKLVRDANGELRIAQKVVRLLDLDSSVPNISFLL